METSLLNPEQITTIPISWFNTVNELATALRLTTSREILSTNSTAEEIDTLQNKILVGLLDLPEDVLSAFHFNITVSKTQMFDIFFDYLERWPVPLSLPQIDKKYELPDNVSRKLINVVIHKIEAYNSKAPKIEGDYPEFVKRYEVFLTLAKDLAIPVEEKNPKTLSKQLLKIELIKLSEEIMDLINKTDDQYLTLRYYRMQPASLRLMIFDHYGLRNIEKPGLTNPDLAKKYGIAKTHNASTIVQTALRILRKHYATFKPKI